MTDRRKMIFLSYDQIALKMDSMINSIIQEQFSSIVVIVRGGLFPGHHLSTKTGLPVYYLSYDRTCLPAKITWIGAPPKKGKVLLVEDLAGSGKTLIESRLYIEDQGFEVKAFVVFKDTKSASTPEYICFETCNPNETFIVPWERAKYHPQFYTLMKQNKKDYELEITAWDYDGIIQSANHLDKLYERTVFQIQKDDVFISSGKTCPESIKVPIGKEVSIHPVYRYEQEEELTIDRKGQIIMETGCIRYVESDGIQAMLLANKFPHLEVIWWNRGFPIAIKASSLQEIS